MQKTKYIMFIMMISLFFYGCGAGVQKININEDVAEDVVEDAIGDSEIMIIEETDIHEEKETTESDREFEEGKNRSNGFTEVAIERIDRSVYDEEGRLITIMYYDKPVISGDFEAAHKINTYFQNESEAFFGNGHSVIWFSNDACREFENGLELMQECWGNETMAEYPCRYAMDTRISYLDDDLISIMQIRNYSLEQNSWYCYGSTFDLKTGELLPITELVSLSPEELKKIMSDISYNDADCYDDLRKENYVIDFYGHIIDMQYEYFFDGKYYYIINDFGEAFKTSTVIKWNGKWGDEYAVSAFQYSIDRENEKIIRYKTCEKEE